MTPPSCEAVRARINKLIEAGIMNKTEFAKAIGCRGTGTLSSFMNKTGRRGGSQSSVWYMAFAWFKQREVAGLKMPDVTKRQKLDADRVVAAAVAAPATASPPVRPTIPGRSVTMAEIRAAAAPAVVANIFLPGEEDGTVYVFDSCDEVRRKINAHLLRPGVTQAGFCRELTAQMPPGTKAILTAQLATFRGKQGAIAGAKTNTFYAAYVYFEKVRLVRKEPKTEHRLGMEIAWDHGMNRDVDEKSV